VIIALVLFVILVGIVLGGAYGLFRLAGPSGATPAALAWRTAQGAFVAFVVAIMVYQKPQSFYINFVIVPAIFCYLAGLCCVILTIVLAIAAFLKRTATRRAAESIGLALATWVVATLIIWWRAH
jgi:hypothetical protein